jgi:hypothetical protein
VTVIDGVRHTTSHASVGTTPYAVAVNPVQGIPWTANYGSNNVSGVTISYEVTPYVSAGLNPIDGDTVYQSTPGLSGWAECWQHPQHTRMLGVLDRLGTSSPPFDWADITYGAGTDSVAWDWHWGFSDSLSFGENFLTYIPLDVSAATTNNQGQGTSFVGNRYVQPVYRLHSGGSGTESPSERGVEGPSLGITPNPAHDRILVSYTPPQTGPVSLDLHDASGRLARTLVSAAQSSGRHSVLLRATADGNAPLASGIYFVKLVAGERRLTQKLVLE